MDFYILKKYKTKKGEISPCRALDSEVILDLNKQLSCFKKEVSLNV
jgi:hypothetical protein